MLNGVLPKDGFAGIAPYIYNGQNADDGRFPYFSFLYVEQNRTDRWYCGASLIHPQVLMTAAHCAVTKYRKAEAYVSSNNMWPNDGLTVTIPPKSMKIHPRYDDYSLVNDIALIFLDKPVAAGTVKLAKKNSYPVLNTRYPVNAIGYGLYNKRDLSYTLREAKMDSLSTDDCTALLRAKLDWPRYRLDPGQICAMGYEIKANGGVEGICQGDSGGPLFVKGATWEDDVVYGLTSWTLVEEYGGCGQFGSPNGFTEVGVFEGWIKSTIDKEGLDSSQVSFVTINAPQQSCSR